MKSQGMNRARRAALWASMAAAWALGLAGCSGPAARPNVAVFDLGSPTAMEAIQSAPSWLGAVDVTAPSWLDSRAMQYRLAAEPARRQSYAEHRWAANPSELLAASLRRQLGAAGGEGCRLRIELDEWVQSFDAEGNSQIQLSFRAGLLPARGNAVLARRAFSAQQAAGRDPRQGVAAFIAVERQLAGDLARWLETQAKEQRDFAARCRA